MNTEFIEWTVADIIKCKRELKLRGFNMYRLLNLNPYLLNSRKGRNLLKRLRLLNGQKVLYDTVTNETSRMPKCEQNLDYYAKRTYNLCRDHLGERLTNFLGHLEIENPKVAAEIENEICLYLIKSVELSIHIWIKSKLQNNAAESHFIRSENLRVGIHNIEKGGRNASYIKQVWDDVVGQRDCSLLRLVKARKGWDRYLYMYLCTSLKLGMEDKQNRIFRGRPTLRTYENAENIINEIYRPSLFYLETTRNQSRYSSSWSLDLIENDNGLFSLVEVLLAHKTVCGVWEFNDYSEEVDFIKNAAQISVVPSLELTRKLIRNGVNSPLYYWESQNSNIREYSQYGKPKGDCGFSQLMKYVSEAAKILTEIALPIMEVHLLMTLCGTIPLRKVNFTEESTLAYIDQKKVGKCTTVMDSNLDYSVQKLLVNKVTTKYLTIINKSNIKRDNYELYGKLRDLFQPPGQILEGETALEKYADNYNTCQMKIRKEHWEKTTLKGRITPR